MLVEAVQAWVSLATALERAALESVTPQIMTATTQDAANTSPRPMDAMARWWD